MQQKFQEFMPPIGKEYPKIYLSNNENFDEVMNKIGTEMKFSAHLISLNTFTEFFHGNLYDAILIHTERLTEELYPDFAISFWKQLGYFYMTNILPQEWFDLYCLSEDEWENYCESRIEDNEVEIEDLDLDKEFEIRSGCLVWLPFVTATIAQILLKRCSLPEFAYSEQSYLQAILNKKYISEEDIGTYFALILTNTVDENMLSIPDNIERFLGEFKKILGEQSLKESFWVIDDKILQEIEATYLALKAVFAIDRIKNSLDIFGTDNQYSHEHVKPIAPTATELKKKQKAKHKAQKQARKNNRRK